VEYAPQRPYIVGLVTGLVIAGLMLLLAALLLVRTRLRAPVESPRPPLRRREARRGLVRPGVTLVAGLVAAGLPGLVGALLAQGRTGRGVRLAAAGMLVAAGSLVTATSFALDGPGLIPDASDLLAGTGAVLALVLGLSGRRDDGD